MSTDTMISQVRRFNRTATQRVGALSDHYLARGHMLGASRVLWEIGVEGCEVRALRARLDLDSGQMSRLLRSLEADGLIDVVPSPADRRVRVARLTPAGRSERAVLDASSDELANSVLAPLSAHQRQELVAAMGMVERLLTTSMVDIRIADPASADAQRCLWAYFAELNRRSEQGFDPAEGVSAHPHELRDPAGAFLIAYRSGEAIGCAAVKHCGEGPSDIKRMWVAETARGVGIGRRLLHTLEGIAREHGASATRLETNEALTEAIALYRSAGYLEVSAFNDEPFAHHWFHKAIDKSVSPALAAA
jgi:DNA-binding MarR family transcriptional regulator/GNAT superfamily N-acetyltransferase